MNHICRTLAELATLFIFASVFSVLSPHLGLMFAVILSFASQSGKIYSRKFIHTNIKLISLKSVILVLYVITVWFMTFNPSFPSLFSENLIQAYMTSFWIGLLFFALLSLVNDKLSKLEEVVR